MAEASGGACSGSCVSPGEDQPAEEHGDGGVAGEQAESAPGRQPAGRHAGEAGRPRGAERVADDVKRQVGPDGEARLPDERAADKTIPTTTVIAAAVCRMIAPRPS